MILLVYRNKNVWPEFGEMGAYPAFCVQIRPVNLQTDFPFIYVT